MEKQKVQFKLCLIIVEKAKEFIDNKEAKTLIELVDDNTIDHMIKSFFDL